VQENKDDAYSEQTVYMQVMHLVTVRHYCKGDCCDNEKCDNFYYTGA